MNMLSFCPRSFGAPEPEVSFTPLFRLLGDFDNYSREVQSAPAGRRQVARRPRSQPATFNPRFDVRETEGAYELHGELPGLERENLDIEFPEPQTIVIRGRVERRYGLESKSNSSTSDAIATENNNATETARRSSHQPTVEDDPEDENTPASTPPTSPKTTEVVKPALVADEAQDGARFWLRERSVGEFSRTFTFPARVDADAVTACLSNGVLSVTVPKAKKPFAKRIEINTL